jgi:hypothetical protein
MCGSTSLLAIWLCSLLLHVSAVAPASAAAASLPAAGRTVHCINPWLLSFCFYFCYHPMCLMCQHGPVPVRLGGQISGLCQVSLSQQHTELLGHALQK